VSLRATLRPSSRKCNGSKEELVRIIGPPSPRRRRRADWLPGLSADADRDRLEPLLAWGKPMLLDTSYVAAETEEEQPRLSELRAALIADYPQVGPILV
jgi:hypothetical protein